MPQVSAGISVQLSGIVGGAPASEVPPTGAMAGCYVRILRC